ncbi:MAG: nuclease [Legionella sp.]|nr:MAG: nuclease [Legionella sp.]
MDSGNSLKVSAFALIICAKNIKSVNPIFSIKTYQFFSGLYFITNNYIYTNTYPLVIKNSDTDLYRITNLTLYLCMLKYVTFFLILGASFPGFSWSANGHRVIGQIAYERLTPKAKRTFAHLNQSLNRDHRRYSLVAASVWLDALYDPRYLALKPIHYIDLPYSVDGTTLPKVASRNAVSAIETASTKVMDSSVTDTERATSLRILLHVVGDLHQPLHAITRVSHAHPQGDRGGNEFRLGKNSVAPNLHRYWDRGGGLLSPKMNAIAVKDLAKSIGSEWTCPSDDQNVMHWAETSHALAITQAYAIKEYESPSAAYEKNTQRIVRQQLAYAGCRLASLLNHLVVK